MRRISISAAFFAFIISTVFWIETNRFINQTIYSYYNIQTPAPKKDLVMNISRQLVRIETWDYDFSDSGVERLEDLLLTEGGTPIRSMVLSTWRSGSSFLGDLLNSVPGTFYNYEPLMKYGGHQIRDPKDSYPSKIIREMLKCNYNGMDEFYFEYAKKIRHNVDMIKLNKRLWQHCFYDEEEFCYNPGFVSEICKLFPFQVMKTVRLRLPVVKPILEDDELNTRIVLLVRDPRAVLHSRQGFCDMEDCINPEIVCRDMATDYEAAVEYSEKYPDMFMALRYEDLILDLDVTINQVLNFLRLSRTPSVDKFLEYHTSVNSSEPFSTFRVSKEIPFKWRHVMNFTHVHNIQNVCRNAMTKWGYVLAHNASHMTSQNFSPIQPYILQSELLTFFELISDVDK